MRSHLVFAIATITSLAACAADPQPVAKQAAQAPPPPVAEVRPPLDATHFPDVAERRELFDNLVADYRKWHVFSEATQKALGITWEDTVPGLRREFEDAVDENGLNTALLHFATSLHNPHCGFQQPSLPPAAKTTGFEAESEWRGGSAHFYVRKIRDAALKDKLTIGDEIVEFEGIPAAELPRRRHLQSNQNNWRGIARDVAQTLSGPNFTRIRKLGSVSKYVFEKRAAHERFTLDLTWVALPTDAEERSTVEDPIDYDSKSCAVLPDRAYGPGYELVARGSKLCVYASRAPGYRDYPIIRQFSYHYIDVAPLDRFARHAIHADYDVQKRELDRIRPKGVILDLRDNAGGNNPNWFIDWYATGPYTDDFIATRLSPDFDTKEKLEAAHIWHADQYLAALAARKPGEDFTAPMASFCKTKKDGSDDCFWDNRYTPSHRVTKAPMAALVGPGCVSSCDAIALDFEREHFGPLIGEPPASGTTSLRLDRPIVLPGGRKFGVLKVAFTREYDGKTRELMEGVPTHVDVPLDRTFDNRTTYDKDLVDAAIRALATPANH